MPGRNILKLSRGNKSRQEVAEALGLSQQAIACYERGTRTPRRDNMKKIAEYYGRTVDELFFGCE